MAASSMVGSEAGILRKSSHHGTTGNVNSNQSHLGNNDSNTLYQESIRTDVRLRKNRNPCKITDLITKDKRRSTGSLIKKSISRLGSSTGLPGDMNDIQSNVDSVTEKGTDRAGADGRSMISCQKTSVSKDATTLRSTYSSAMDSPPVFSKFNHSNGLLGTCRRSKQKGILKQYSSVKSNNTRRGKEEVELEQRERDFEEMAKSLHGMSMKSRRPNAEELRDNELPSENPTPHSRRSLTPNHQTNPSGSPGPGPISGPNGFKKFGRTCTYDSALDMDKYQDCMQAHHQFLLDQANLSEQDRDYYQSQLTLSRLGSSSTYSHFLDHISIGQGLQGLPNKESLRSQSGRSFGGVPGELRENSYGNLNRHRSNPNAIENGPYGYIVPGHSGDRNYPEQNHHPYHPRHRSLHGSPNLKDRRQGLLAHQNNPGLNNTQFQDRKLHTKAPITKTISMPVGSEPQIVMSKSEYDKMMAENRAAQNLRNTVRIEQMAQDYPHSRERDRYDRDHRDRDREPMREPEYLDNRERVSDAYGLKSISKSISFGGSQDTFTDQKSVLYDERNYPTREQMTQEPFKNMLDSGKTTSCGSIGVNSIQLPRGQNSFKYRNVDHERGRYENSDHYENELPSALRSSKSALSSSSLQRSIIQNRNSQRHRLLKNRNSPVLTGSDQNVNNTAGRTPGIPRNRYSDLTRTNTGSSTISHIPIFEDEEKKGREPSERTRDRPLAAYTSIHSHQDTLTGVSSMSHRSVSGFSSNQAGSFWDLKQQRALSQGTLGQKSISTDSYCNPVPREHRQLALPVKTVSRNLSPESPSDHPDDGKLYVQEFLKNINGPSIAIRQNPDIHGENYPESVMYTESLAPEMAGFGMNESLRHGSMSNLVTLQNHQQKVRSGANDELEMHQYNVPEHDLSGSDQEENDTIMSSRGSNPALEKLTEETNNLNISGYERRPSGTIKPALTQKKSASRTLTKKTTSNQSISASNSSNTSRSKKSSPSPKISITKTISTNTQINDHDIDTSTVGSEGIYFNGSESEYSTNFSNNNDDDLPTPVPQARVNPPKNSDEVLVSYLSRSGQKNNSHYSSSQFSQNYQCSEEEIGANKVGVAWDKNFGPFFWSKILAI